MESEGNITASVAGDRLVPEAGACSPVVGDGRPLAQRLEQVLTESYSRPDLSVPQLARMLGIHHRTLQRRLLSETGTTPTDFLHRYRLERARRLLRSGRAVTEVAMEVGYKTTAHFSTRFKSVFGESPSEVRSRPVHD